jgi:hypothetical protein
LFFFLVYDQEMVPAMGKKNPPLACSTCSEL